jgi:hypothetical protein
MNYFFKIQFDNRVAEFEAVLVDDGRYKLITGEAIKVEHTVTIRSETSETVFVAEYIRSIDGEFYWWDGDGVFVRIPRCIAFPAA